MSNLKLRTSKFRHVYGGQTRREQWFENIRITRNTHDSDFCSVNPNFLAVVLESSGGGAFAVLDVNRPGRVDVNCPKVCGHAGAVLDVKWNPFNDFVIASASEDATVKLWTIPQQGLSGVLTDWSADLHGHSRKVAYLDWHPLAENVLMSVGFDKKIMIWNVEQAEPITSLPLHPDTVFSVGWSRDGATIASTCKDKKIRVLDARSAKIAVEMTGHMSPKTSKCVYVNDHAIFTTGFSRTSNRQYALWDVRQPGKPTFIQDTDCSSGIVLPYFDPDTNMVYMAGKGDGMIRYIEVQSDPSDVFFLSYYQSPLPQRGLGMMPKRGVDTSKNELTRFYKLHASKNLVEPVPMIAPRKAEGFLHDIYPPTFSNLASLSADEWTTGINRGPILLNLEDGSIMDKPRTSMSAAVQSPMGNLSKMPEITTYKAVNNKAAATTPTAIMGHAHQHFSSSNQQQSPPPPTAWRTSPDGLQAPPVTHENGSGGYHNNKLSPGEAVPSSIKNIQRLSMTFEQQDSLQQTSPHHQPSPSPSPFLSSAQSMTSLRSTTPQNPPLSPHHTYHHTPSPYNNNNQPMRTASCTVLNGVRNDSSSGPHHLEIQQQHQQPKHNEINFTPGFVVPKNYETYDNYDYNDDNKMPKMTKKTSSPSWSSPKTQTPYYPSSSGGGDRSNTNTPTLTPLNNAYNRRTPTPPTTPAFSSAGHVSGVSAVKLVLGTPQLSPTTPTPTPTNTSTTSSSSIFPPPANAIHVRKVWTPPASPATNVSGNCPSNDSELKKAYFRQLGEIKSLQEQLLIKDRRIKDLETELSRALTEGAGPNEGESNC